MGDGLSAVSFFGLTYRKSNCSEGHVYIQIGTTTLGTPRPPPRFCGDTTIVSPR